MHRKRFLLIGTLVAALLATAHPCFGQGPTSGQGSISIELSSEVIVPGQRLDVFYQTSPGTLQGPVDIYVTLQPPEGAIRFLQPNKRFSETEAAFRSDVTIRERTKKLFRFYPVRQTFGTYTYSAVLLPAGTSFEDAESFASEIASSSYTFDPLSEIQQSIVEDRGNPDLLTLTWTGALKHKLEVWSYYSDTPTQYKFLNGELDGQKTLSDSAGGVAPQIDPRLLTPQTTREHLTSVFGLPSSQTRFVDGAPGYVGVTFAAGVEAVFVNGRLVFAATFVP